MKITIKELNIPIKGTGFYFVARATEPKTKRFIEMAGVTEADALKALDEALERWQEQMDLGRNAITKHLDFLKDHENK